MFEVGDLVEYTYDLLYQELVGVVTYRYTYSNHMWYKVLWSTGKCQDIAEVELKKVKTDKK